MQIGIMANTFVRPTLEDVLDAVVSHGLQTIQFGFSCVGLSDLPAEADDALCHRIRKGLSDRGITMAAVSGTFNMIHPDVSKRLDGLKRLRVLASMCEGIGTSVITLCTGTRDPGSMWRRHPDNDLPDAWDDLVSSMRAAVEIAEEYKVTLAFEPEVSNVVDSAAKGRRLINQIQSPYLKVVMDPANIFHKGELTRMKEILDEAFVLLGDFAAIAHAKDLDHDGEAGHKPAGKGVLDYRQYLAWLNSVDFDMPVILHGLREEEVDECVSFIQSTMKSLS